MQNNTSVILILLNKLECFLGLVAMFVRPVVLTGVASLYSLVSWRLSSGGISVF